MQALDAQLSEGIHLPLPEQYADYLIDSSLEVDDHFLVIQANPDAGPEVVTCILGTYLEDNECHACSRRFERALECTAEKALSCGDDYLLINGGCYDCDAEICDEQGNLICPPGYYMENRECLPCEDDSIYEACREPEVPIEEEEEQEQPSD